MMMMVDTVSLPEPEVGELELPAQVVAVLFEYLTRDAQRADARPRLELGRRYHFVRASVRLLLERQWDAFLLLLVVAGVDSWRGASAGMSKSPPTDLRITCDQKTYIKLASTLLAV